MTKKTPFIKTFTRHYYDLNGVDENDSSFIKGVHISTRGASLSCINDDSSFVPIKKLCLRIDKLPNEKDLLKASVKMNFINVNLVVDGMVVKLKASIESDEFNLDHWIYMPLKNKFKVKTLQFHYWFLRIWDFSVRVAFRRDDNSDLHKMNVECENNIKIKDFADIVKMIFIYYNFQFNRLKYINPEEDVTKI